MPNVHEIVMAPGSWSVPFNRDPELEAALEEFLAVRFYEGRTLMFAGPILDDDESPEVFTVEGALMPWWLGVDNEGPGVDFRRYFSRRNRLSNGGFEFGDIYWRRGQQGGKWFVSTSTALNGQKHARCNGDIGDDDVLQSEESFEVFPGDVYALRAVLHHPSGGQGSVRLRLIYSGRFDHPELNADTGFGQRHLWQTTPEADIITDPNYAYEGEHVLRMGPFTRQQQVNNGSFEEGFGENTIGWWQKFHNVEVSDERAHKGTKSAKFTSGGVDTAALWQDMVGSESPDDEFRAGVTLYSADPDAPFVIRVRYPTDDGIKVDEVVHQPPFSEGGWRRFSGDFSMSEWNPSLGRPKLILAADEIIAEGGAWFADDVQVKRTRGNVQRVRWIDREHHAPGNMIGIVPKRTYRLRAKVRSEKRTYSGEVWFEARVRKTHYQDEIEPEAMQSPTVQLTDGKWTTVEWEFTPESAYDKLELGICGRDIFGGSFFIDNVSIKDADPTTWVDDREVMVSQATSPINLGVYEDAPEGAESVHAEIAAEKDGEGWRVDDVNLTLLKNRTSARKIVLDAIEDAGLLPGKVYTAGYILFDWVIRNRTARQNLDDVSGTGLVQPAREWRVRPDGKVDWGKPSQIFKDRTDILFTEWDAQLLRRPSVKRTHREFVKRVKVIGGERSKLNGRRFLVTGEATNPVGTYKRPDGTAFDRTLFLDDGSVDHKGYATARAKTVAKERAAPRPSHVIGVSDWRHVGRFDNGDWIHLWMPSIGIEDEGNARVGLLGPTYPEKIRCLERRWTLGSGPWRVVLVRPDGTELDVSEFVVWPEATSAELTVGNLRREFVSNPQGGSVSRQYQRYRAAVGEA